MYLPLLAITSVSAVISTVGSVEYTNFTSFNNESYKVSWTFNSSAAIFYFKTEVKASGWIAFGVSRLLYGTEYDDSFSRGTMDMYDVAIGGVENGESYLWDAITNGLNRAPLRDAQQDWFLTNASEVNGVTTLEFNRKLDTGDKQNDNKITPGRRFFVWAYHSTVDAKYNFTNITTQKHTARGHKEIVLIPREEPTRSPDLSSPTSEPSCGASIVAAISNILLLLSVVVLLHK